MTHILHLIPSERSEALDAHWLPLSRAPNLHRQSMLAPGWAHFMLAHARKPASSSAGARPQQRWDFCGRLETSSRAQRRSRRTQARNLAAARCRLDSRRCEPRALQAAQQIVRAFSRRAARVRGRSRTHYGRPHFRPTSFQIDLSTRSCASRLVAECAAHHLRASRREIREIVSGVAVAASPCLRNVSWSARQSLCPFSAALAASVSCHRPPRLVPSPCDS